MPVPTNISGSIVPRNATEPHSLPKVGWTGPNANFPIVSNANSSELFTKTPAYSKSAGSTLDGLGSIYLNSSNFSTLNRTVTFGFMPDFYIAATAGLTNEVNMGWVFANNYVNFSTAVPNITADINDKFEVFYINYSQTAFLTAAGGGATANAITELTFGKAVLDGSQELTAKQIYYRYLGNINNQS